MNDWAMNGRAMNGRAMNDEVIWAMTVEVDQLRGSTRSVSKDQFKGFPPQIYQEGVNIL